MAVKQYLRVIPATCQLYGQRLTHRFNDLLGRHFLWRSYGNTLSLQVNRRYAQYAAACRRAYAEAGNAPLDWGQSPLRQQGFYHLPCALPESEALAMSETITQSIQQGRNVSQDKNTELVTALLRPLDVLGTRLLDIFRGPLDDLLRTYFGCYYRIHWLDCYRSQPTTLRKQAWLWHSDNVPQETAKIMLHFTPADEHRGAMRFFDWQTSTRYRECGYFGVDAGERLDDLVPFARQHGLPHEPRYVRAAAGDVLLFNNNLLHKAVPPTMAHRDVMTILLLPSPRPWHAVLAEQGLDSIQNAPGGYVSDPWQMASSNKQAAA